MIIVYNGKLPSLNEVIDANRKNKFAGAKMKKEIQRSISTVVKQQCKESFQKISISIKWYEPNRKRDFDNISSATKFILDSLVNCNVIENDGWKNIAPCLHHEFYIDKDNPRVEISIEEFSE